MPRLPVNKQRALGVDTRPRRGFCIVGGCTYDIDGVCDFEDINQGAVDALDFVDGGMSVRCCKIKDDEKARGD